MNSEPVIENLAFDKRDDTGNDMGDKIVYGFDYSPCQFNLNNTLYIKIAGVEGKANFSLSIHFDYLDNYKVVCANGGTLPPISQYRGVVQKKESMY
jgi:hypothetical protein